jgi:predicted TIM-barrel fold metal-dependent hydrolase
VIAAEVAGPAAPAAPTHKAGAIPAYLLARQRAWAAAAEEQRLAVENADVPKGMRLMSDAEKAESLELLKASMADAKDELSRFKLRVEVPSQIRRKAELEEKLKKMEDAHAVFMRPRVFVPVDA